MALDDDPPIDDGSAVPNSENNGVDLTGSSQNNGTPGSDDTSNNSGTNPTSSTPQPWWEHRYVPACSANGPDGGADALCGAAVNTCPADRDIRYTVYRRLVEVNGDRGDWERVGSECRGPDEPAGIVRPEVTAELVIDHAAALAPVSDVRVEPENTTYVNIPTNFSTQQNGATITVNLLGRSIPVTFTPTSYQWHFGDGENAKGAGIENAAVHQAGAVEHGYARAGEYGVTVTRIFTATFTLGGERVSIPGEISTTSNTYALTVGEIQSTVTGVH